MSMNTEQERILRSSIRQIIDESNGRRVSQHDGLDEGALGNALKGILGNVMSALQGAVNSLKRGIDKGAEKRVGGKTPGAKEEIDAKTEKDLVVVTQRVTEVIADSSERFDNEVIKVIKSTKKAQYTSHVEDYDKVCEEIAKTADALLGAKVKEWAAIGEQAGLTPAVSFAAVMSGLYRALGGKV